MVTPLSPGCAGSEWFRGLGFRVRRQSDSDLPSRSLEGRRGGCLGALRARGLLSGLGFRVYRV